MKNSRGATEIYFQVGEWGGTRSPGRRASATWATHRTISRIKTTNSSKISAEEVGPLVGVVDRNTWVVETEHRNGSYAKSRSTLAAFLTAGEFANRTVSDPRVPNETSARGGEHHARTRDSRSIFAGTNRLISSPFLARAGERGIPRGKINFARLIKSSASPAKTPANTRARIRRIVVRGA